MTHDNNPELICQAREGDLEALGRLLKGHRPYLRMLAARGIDPILSTRLSGSDLVQQACLEAHRDFQSFRGKSERELLAWLRRILQHTIAEATHVHILAEKRSVKRERRPLLGDSGQEPLEFPAEAQSSPSARAMRDEAAVELAAAMEQLAADQCEALRQRYLEGRSLALIAEHMQRSESAVASLLKRGLQGLRQQLPVRG